MKTWQISLVGVVGLVALLLLPHYERSVAAVGAIVIITVVVAGFIAIPRHEVFIVRTNLWTATPDDISLEHNCLIVRVTLARLWLLFVPTCFALAFLIVAATRGTIWNLSLFDRWQAAPYFIGRVLVLIVWGITTTWVSERWILRDADAACSARSATVRDARVSYYFIDMRGRYYGGEAIAFNLTESIEISAIVLYNERKPDKNKIAIACLFHRLSVIGNGLADLDEETAALHRPAILSNNAGATRIG